jgi:hypothetical protein
MGNLDNLVSAANLITGTPATYGSSTTPILRPSGENVTQSTSFQTYIDKKIKGGFTGAQGVMYDKIGQFKGNLNRAPGQTDIPMQMTQNIQPNASKFQGFTPTARSEIPSTRSFAAMYNPMGGVTYNRISNRDEIFIRRPFVSPGNTVASKFNNMDQNPKNLITPTKLKRKQKTSKIKPYLSSKKSKTRKRRPTRKSTPIKAKRVQLNNAPQRGYSTNAPDKSNQMMNRVEDRLRKFMSII